MTKDKYWWYNKESEDVMKRGYLIDGQTIQEKIDKVCEYSSKILKRPDLKERFKEVFERGWASMSSPIWANFGEDRGLPISCFSSHLEDNLPSIYDNLKEVALMTKAGGGTAGYFSKLRPKGSSVKGGATSTGAISFLEEFNNTTSKIMQNGVRRGYFAGYMDIDHPEYKEFLKVKDKGNSMQSINTATNIPRGWMQSMIDGDKEKRELWALTLKSRREKGIPYLHFLDNVNDQAPQVYKDKGLEIVQSNLCNEIELHTSGQESLVCCLLSMNLYLYDEWKDTDAIQLMIYFLDSVMTDFIQKAKDMPGFERAVKFAENQRALGLGVLGYSSYLQSKSIPFETMEAQRVNVSIFKNLQEQSSIASKKLAEEYGEPPLLKGYGMRNATLNALAPTTTSSSILGQVSPSIEIGRANYFKVGLAKGSFSRRNPELEKVLDKYGKNTEDVWLSIGKNNGSVSNLDFLSEHEKQVFKTFEEVSPLVVIQHAAARQPYIDQSQSVNLLIPHTVDFKTINSWHIEAWKLGLKGLYYQRGTSVAKSKVQEMLDCASCSA